MRRPQVGRRPEMQLLFDDFNFTRCFVPPIFGGIMPHEDCIIRRSLEIDVPAESVHVLLHNANNEIPNGEPKLVGANDLALVYPKAIRTQEGYQKAIAVSQP